MWCFFPKLQFSAASLQFETTEWVKTDGCFENHQLATNKIFEDFHQVHGMPRCRLIRFLKGRTTLQRLHPCLGGRWTSHAVTRFKLVSVGDRKTGWMICWINWVVSWNFMEFPPLQNGRFFSTFQKGVKAYWISNVQGVCTNGSIALKKCCVILCNFNHPGIPKKKVADRPWEKKDLKSKNWSGGTTLWYNVYNL